MDSFGMGDGHHCIMFRIVVLGNSGSGKSTLSSALADHYDIPRLVVDQHIWSSGWKQGDRDKFADLHEQWLNKPSWLIDGIGPWPQLLARLSAATHAIHFDLPVTVCLERAEARIAAENTRPNPHVASGCRYSDVVDLQQKVIYRYHADIRPKLAGLLQDADCKLLEYSMPSSAHTELAQALQFLGPPTKEPNNAVHQTP
jgi:adenylate kinase family enzyme